MYILSFDLGSTNFKVVVMRVSGDNINLVGTRRDYSTDFYEYLKNIYKVYNISNNEIEIIIATGTGSSYINDYYDGVRVIKIKEFDAIAYGGILLSKLDKAIVVSIGTGTVILKSDLNEVVYLGGTGLGGGTIVGLGKLLIGSEISANASGEYFSKIISLSENGNHENVDLTIGDISKENIGNLTKDITASNFAGICKKANKNDYAAAIINLVLENILLLVKYLNVEKLPVVVIGTITGYSVIKNRIKELENFMGNKYNFIEYFEFAIAIGAYEYYLLRMRINNGR